MSEQYQKVIFPPLGGQEGHTEGVQVLLLLLLLLLLLEFLFSQLYELREIISGRAIIRADAA